MNILSKHNETIERLQNPGHLKLEQGKGRFSKIQVMSILAPHEPIKLVIYRIEGKILDPLLRPLLTEARSSSYNETEGEKRFKNLTYTLTNVLAPHADMAWHNTTRYLSTQDCFTDIEVLVLADKDSPSIQGRFIESVVSWLSSDLLKERLGELAKCCKKLLDDGVSREEITLEPPLGSSLVAYPEDTRYFMAMALMAANRLRQNPEIASLLSQDAALAEGKAPIPALNIYSSQCIELIGEPEMKTSSRWVSNILRFQPRTDIGYGQLTINCSLHSRVYGDIKLPEKEEIVQTRQLLLYRRQANELIMHQYPFTLSSNGADFEHSLPNNTEDLAGRSIRRLYSATAGPVSDQIPLKAAKYKSVLAMPLLAQGLGDTEVAAYTGATAPERYDVFSVIQRALASKNYRPLPELSLLSQTLPRNCNKSLKGVSAFRQTAVTNDPQESKSRRTLLAEFLRQRGGAITLPVLLAESRAQDFAISGNDWVVALSHWSGLKTTERWTTPRLNRQFKYMESGLTRADQHGTGSWTLFTGRSEDGTNLQIRAEIHALRSVDDQTLKSIVDEREWDRYWLWLVQAEIVDEAESHTLLPTAIIDNADKLTFCDTLDKHLAFETPTPTALKIRRELVACQLGTQVAIPVFTLREDLRKVIADVLNEIIGRPNQISFESYGEVWDYPELKIWLGYLPQTSQNDDVGIGLSSLLPKLSRSNWRKELTMHGQQRQRIWLRELKTLKELLDGWQILPLVALPWGSQDHQSRDPKPWLRDIFNRLGLTAKFMLQSKEAPARDKHAKNERQRIKASLLAQLSNHGVAPLDISGLLRGQTAITNLVGLTVVRNMGEVIPVVWKVSENNITQIGLKDSDGGICWLSTVEAAKQMAARNQYSSLSFSQNLKTQQEEATIFWERLVDELDKTQTLLLVNGESARLSFTRFMNQGFNYDRTNTNKLIVVRIDASNSPQYFAVEDSKSNILASGFDGFYSHTGEPRRNLLLAKKPNNTPSYITSKLENRFLGLSKQPMQWPDLVSLESTDKEKDRKIGKGQGSQMRRLVECVITDLPKAMRKDTTQQQYIHGLVKYLQSTHVDYSECTNLPYPLHELHDFAGDMIKITPVKGIEI
ncbi:RNaseH domain-containing protein [Vibrio cholerae]|uniref:RNaseH domain-containing protein n=1 Tax=Vibrio cholerae TaxID=666 RepID=UPI0029353360|nr:RNaseH domain-containing protein [Vibrio cholerae]MDV2372763.1 RNaseH domain-containing protein [Vibrio cholerae]